MNIFEFLVIAVVVQAISKIVRGWLKTREGVSQTQIKELEQRIHILEAQHVKDLQKRIGVLEEIFVTEDIELQRKLRHALSFDSLTPPRTDSQPMPPSLRDGSMLYSDAPAGKLFQHSPGRGSEDRWRR